MPTGLALRNFPGPGSSHFQAFLWILEAIIIKNKYVGCLLVGIEKMYRSRVSSHTDLTFMLFVQDSLVLDHSLILWLPL